MKRYDEVPLSMQSANLVLYLSSDAHLSRAIIVHLDPKEQRCSFRILEG